MGKLPFAVQGEPVGGAHDDQPFVIVFPMGHNGNAAGFGAVADSLGHGGIEVQFFGALDLLMDSGEAHAIGSFAGFTAVLRGAADGVAL